MVHFSMNDIGVIRNVFNFLYFAYIMVTLLCNFFLSFKELYIFSAQIYFLRFDLLICLFLK